MEKIIYDWLKEDTILLESVLILSLSGYYISKNEINKICKDDLEKHEKLNEEQFKMLKEKNIILQNKNDNNEIKLEYLKKEFNKINCSFYLIIENNNKINKILNNNKNCNNTNNDEINNICNNKNKINENLNNNDNDNNVIYSTKTIKLLNNKKSKKLRSELFRKVWKNIVIKNQILLEVRLYNIHYNTTMTFSNISSLQSYRYRGYLNKIIIEDDEKKEIIEQGIIPWGVEKIEFKFNPILKESSIPNSVCHLKFGYSFNRPFNSNIISGIESDDCNLKSLIFGNSFNQPLETTTTNENNEIINDDKWLSKLNKLTNLEFGESFQQDIKIGQLPISLTSLVLSKHYNGIIENGALTNSILNNNNSIFKFKFDSNGNKNSIIVNDVNSIPKYVTTLEFDNQFNQVIHNGDIPKNVGSIIFGKEFNSFIEPFSINSNVTSIEFGYRFNQPIVDNQLPVENLTNLTFGNNFNQTIEPHQFSKNLKKLKYGLTFNRTIQAGLYFNTSLESLKFGPRFNQQIPLKTLPNTLKYLDLYGWTGPIVPGTFPQSLKSLKLNYFNQPLQVSSLPSLISLELLEDFNQPININTIPTSLKSLKLGRNYSQDLTNSLPESLTSLDISSTNLKFNIDLLPNLNSIILSNYDHNYLNNLDFQIFSNLIKIK
ncbi:hypothetical protein ACTFIW_012677 [Dictyostelium discoideum]